MSRHEIDKVTVRESDDLKVRRDPYWGAPPAKGLFIGFRKTDADGGGTWIARQLDRKGKQKFQALGSVAHVTYHDAIATAIKWGRNVLDGIGKSEVKTIRDLCHAYVEHNRQKKGEDNALALARNYKNHVLGHKIADIKVKDIEYQDIFDWRNQLAVDSNNTKDRILTDLKSALNHAVKILKIVPATHASEWRQVTDIGEVKQRKLYLNKGGRGNLLEASRDDAKPLVRTMCVLPVRPGALAQCLVEHLHFDIPGKETLWIEFDKANPKRDIPLTPELVEFFTEVAKGKKPTDPLFTDQNGLAWNNDSWKYVIQQARKKANLNPKTCAYTLRHSVMTDMINGGMSLITVSKIAGTSLEQIDKYYGKLVDDLTRQQMSALAF
jgi:integrase